MKDNTHSSPQKLYQFLASCGGNWRNTIHISAETWRPGWLMAADRDGKPVIMAVDAFQALAQEPVDPSECRGYLTAAAFGDIFAKYILWQFPDADSRPAEVLDLLSTLF